MTPSSITIWYGFFRSARCFILLRYDTAKRETFELGQAGYPSAPAFKIASPVNDNKDN